MSYLDIKKLCIKNDLLKIVDIKLCIKNSTALIGESGSGKSLSLKAILGLLPNNLRTILEIDSDFLLERKNISFIPQNPFTSLSPLTKIKKQFFCNEEKIITALELVGLKQEIKERFPLELSGGQLQRVIIAMAITKEPKLLLLDEPTTALDDKNKKLILELIMELKEKIGFLILFVTHDITSIKNLCEDILILKDGKIVEEGKTLEVLKNPKDEYTKKLINKTFYNKEFRK